jgi:hypothetical protein
MEVEELLDDVVIVAERQHLVDQEHQREVTGGLLEIGFHLELFAVLRPFMGLRLDQSSPDVGAFDAGHGKQQVLDQECLLDLHWEGAQVLRSFL